MILKLDLCFDMFFQYWFLFLSRGRNQCEVIICLDVVVCWAVTAYNISHHTLHSSTARSRRARMSGKSVQPGGSGFGHCRGHIDDEVCPAPRSLIPIWIYKQDILNPIPHPVRHLLADIFTASPDKATLFAAPQRRHTVATQLKQIAHWSSTLMLDL